MRRIPVTLALIAAGVSTACQQVDAPTSLDLTPQFARSAPRQETIGINVVLREPATAAVLAELATFGNIRGRIDALNALFLTASRSDLPAIQALPFVAAASPDAERSAGPPLPPVAVSDFANGLSTWNLDAVNVTNIGAGRTVAADGSGVYVGVLDTGLLETWRFYFPEERIAVEYARAFGGGGGENGNVSSPTNKWEHDTQAHGTHVTSTILGYSLNGASINGVAPRATVIPVKVLNNNGSGWSSVIAEGIVYIADLKTGPLSGSPVVINMSLGGPVLDAVEKAAIDYAIARGVIVVASAGNAGNAGMGFPGAYAPVISVGATGWIREWVPSATGNPTNWWVARDVVDPTDAAHFYVTGFSSREKTGQDLDVLAPGSWVVGPWQVNQGHASYFFVGGTSMSSPHVAGLVALMAQSDPSLTAPEAEDVLEATAIPLPAGSRNVLAGPGAPAVPMTWGDDATGSGMVSAPAALAAVGGS